MMMMLMMMMQGTFIFDFTWGSSWFVIYISNPKKYLGTINTISIHVLLSLQSYIYIYIYIYYLWAPTFRLNIWIIWLHTHLICLYWWRVRNNLSDFSDKLITEKCFTMYQRFFLSTSLRFSFSSYIYIYIYIYKGH